MEQQQKFEVIIIGGSFAGLSAAMALGRSMRHVLVIDSGKPCNAQTPHSHNFLTHDGQTPGDILAQAKSDVSKYQTINFLSDIAIAGARKDNGYIIDTKNNGSFHTQKLIVATGLKDQMPDMEGFADCWGISVLHCPYCHGFEVRNRPTAILANGDMAYHYAELISHWTNDLVICTNGKSTFLEVEKQKLAKHNIKVIETAVDRLEHINGQVKALVLEDNSRIAVDAIYSSPPYVQHCEVPNQLGCKLTEEGLIEVDDFQKTSQEGVYACGDNSNFRSVSLAVSSGSVAGIVANKELIADAF